jgi:hypothetical protein
VVSDHAGNPHPPFGFWKGGFLDCSGITKNRGVNGQFPSLLGRHRKDGAFWKQLDQPVDIVGFWKVGSVQDQQSFDVLLHALLSMETNSVSRAPFSQLQGMRRRDEIRVRFPDPFADQVN